MDVKIEAVLDKRVLGSFNDEDFSRRVLNAFHIFRKTSLFCDVILKICGYEVPAHACILAAGSEYFNRFLSQPAPRQYSQIFPQLIEIQIDGSDPNARYEEAVSNVIDFIYTGELGVYEQNIVPQIRELSKIMQLDNLVNFCDDLLLTGPPKNVNIPRISTAKRLNQVSVGIQANLNIKIEQNIDEEDEIDTLSKSKKRIISRRKKKPTKILKVKMNNDKPLMQDSDSATEEDIYNDHDSDTFSDYDFSPVRKKKSARTKVKNGKTLRSKPKTKSKINKSQSKPPSKRKSAPRKRPTSTSTGTGTLPLLNCPECDFQTEKFRILAKHRDIHLNEKNICRFCDLQCKDQDDWTEHVQTHGGTHPYVCTYCDKTFKFRTLQQMHKAKHLEDRPFVCDICGHGFKWKIGLKSHQAVHADVKSYVCEICGYATAHKSQIKAHHKIHTGDLFRCQVEGCKYAAPKRQMLKNHMASHSDERPHQCSICGKAFSLKGGLRRHTRKTHLYGSSAQPQQKKQKKQEQRALFATANDTASAIVSATSMNLIQAAPGNIDPTTDTMPTALPPQNPINLIQQNVQAPWQNPAAHAAQVAHAALASHAAVVSQPPAAAHTVTGSQPPHGVPPNLQQQTINQNVFPQQMYGSMLHSLYYN